MTVETSLPIARRKGRYPSFDIKDLFKQDQETRRFDTDLATIEEVMRQDVAGCQLPRAIVDQFTAVEKWQLVVPHTIDVAQLLFLGRFSDDREHIAFDDSQATIFIHRGAEGGSWSIPNGEYMINWIGIAGNFPDSNGDQRIVEATYLPAGTTRGKSDVTGVNVSISDTEYEITPPLLESFLPPVVQLPTMRSISNTHGLITPAMMDVLVRPQQFALNLHVGEGGFTFHEVGVGSTTHSDIYSYLGFIVDKTSDDVVQVGLANPKEGNPWTVAIPKYLEKTSIHDQ